MHLHKFYPTGRVKRERYIDDAVYTFAIVSCTACGFTKPARIGTVDMTTDEIKSAMELRWGYIYQPNQAPAIGNGYGGRIKP